MVLNRQTQPDWQATLHFQKENEQLRRAVSDLTLDKLILKEVAKGHY